MPALPAPATGECITGGGGDHCCCAEALCFSEEVKQWGLLHLSISTQLIVTNQLPDSDN